jgi:hypothetical protein
MATILEFRAATRNRSNSGEQPAGADIIIFPGVRVERWEAAPERASKPRRRRKRDHLDIED